MSAKTFAALGAAFLFLSSPAWGQRAALSGQLRDTEGEVVPFATVALFGEADSALSKAAATDAEGVFRMEGLAAGRYFLKSSFLGLPDLRRGGIALAEGQRLDLGALRFGSASVELKEAVVTAQRPIVEARPDRTIFNVQGTINATGSDVLSLLRKAPAVVVDNNDNLTVLGRSGTLVYVDGKRLPLAGEELSAYLQNLGAEQIDRIEIITSPGAKHDAQGNAGIIDIRLKKDKSLGANGTVSANYSQGRYHRVNGTASGNYRDRRFNAFGAGSASDRRGFMQMDFESVQNGIFLGEVLKPKNHFSGLDGRAGADFFLSKKATIGFLASGFDNPHEGSTLNQIRIAPAAARTEIDSTLLALTDIKTHRTNGAANANYRFDDGKGRSFNVDLDAARFRTASERAQNNAYFAPSGAELRSTDQFFDAPTQIEIYTAKADFEDKALGGTLGAGAKWSRVMSENSFLVYDVAASGARALDDRRSNRFDYDEKVAAAYASFARPISKKWQFSVGLRAEHTRADGELLAFRPDLQEPPVELRYWRWFPSAGLTWQATASQSWTAGYSRRINRPDYHVLNPFRTQLSQLSYEKGNPFLQPEIVNNAELGVTLAHRYNVKLGYSVTKAQITRLIGPDDDDPRSNFISWDNLAQQKAVGLNVSAPFSLAKWLDVYVNASANYIDNQADYGADGRVDVQVFTYNFYQQSTIKLGRGWRAEVSGWYSGPGVWGGVFLSDPSWSLDLGLQKKFLADRLNLRVTASDIFYQSYWSGVSSFNGLVSAGSGRWDSRRAAVGLSWALGNQNVKSRKRKTGIEDEAKRVGSEN